MQLQPGVHAERSLRSAAAASPSTAHPSHTYLDDNTGEVVSMSSRQLQQ
jgi:hypothetical protein